MSLYTSFKINLKSSVSFYLWTRKIHFHQKQLKATVLMLQE